MKNGKNKIEVGSMFNVTIAGETKAAKVRRVGEGHGQWRMLTLDVEGALAYTVCQESELQGG